MELKWRKNRLDLAMVIGRWVAGVPLVFSSAGHLTNPYAFTTNIFRYDLLPMWMVPFVAAVLPPLMMVVGLSLVLGVTLKGASILAVVHYSMFCFVQMSALVRQMPFDCGCFVWIEQPVSIKSIVPVMVFLLLSILLSVAAFRAD